MLSLCLVTNVGQRLVEIRISWSRIQLQTKTSGEVWPRYLSPSLVVLSIYWGNWVWTEVITVLVSQNNIWLVRWSSCQSWGCPRTSGDPNQRIFGVFSSSLPRLVTHMSMQQKINISDIQIYCYQDEGNWQHILQPSEAFRSSPDHLWILHSYPRTEEDNLEMKGEKGVKPTYIYSAIVIWHNIVLISVVLLSASLSSYIYFHISNV